VPNMPILFKQSLEKQAFKPKPLRLNYFLKKYVNNMLSNSLKFNYFNIKKYYFYYFKSNCFISIIQIIFELTCLIFIFCYFFIIWLFFFNLSNWLDDIKITFIWFNFKIRLNNKSSREFLSLTYWIGLNDNIKKFHKYFFFKFIFFSQRYWRK
jgi:hypothetical protein